MILFSLPKLYHHCLVYRHKNSKNSQNVRRLVKYTHCLRKFEKSLSLVCDLFEKSLSSGLVSSSCYIRSDISKVILDKRLIQNLNWTWPTIIKRNFK